MRRHRKGKACAFNKLSSFELKNRNYVRQDKEHPVEIL